MKKKRIARKSTGMRVDDLSFEDLYSFEDTKIYPEKMRTPLHVAVIEQQTEVVTDLINQGSVNIDAEDYDDKTPMEFAIQSGNVEIVKLLLEASAHVFSSGLSTAVESQNIVILKLFLDKIGNSTFDYSKGHRSPLEIAVSLGNSDIVKHLLDNIDHVKSEFDEKYILHKAVQTRNINIVKLLLEAGANVNTVNKAGNSPLHFALDANNLDIFQLLLNFGANINAKNIDNITPLHLAVKLSNGKDDYIKLIELLLKARGEVNTAIKYNYYTSLHTAAESQNENILKLMLNARLNAGANVSSESYKEETPLHTATKLRNQNIVKLLLDAGAKVDSQMDYGTNSFAPSRGIAK